MYYRWYLENPLSLFCHRSLWMPPKQKQPAIILERWKMFVRSFLGALPAFFWGDPLFIRDKNLDNPYQIPYISRQGFIFSTGHTISKWSKWLPKICKDLKPNCIRYLWKFVFPVSFWNTGNSWNRRFLVEFILSWKWLKF